MKYALSILTALLVLCGCLKSRTPCVYEIPQGFTGWVLIEFEQPGATPLLKGDGKLLFRIGADGRLSTSSKREDGWASDEYYYVGSERMRLKQTGWGGGGMIWGGSTGSTQSSGKPVQVYQNFFVGTEEAFKSSASKQPRPE